MKQVTAARPMVSQHLSPATMDMELHATTPSEVLEELIAHVPALAYEPAARQTLLHALLEREKLGSTGLGHGVAIPHTRDPVVARAGRPVIVFGRHPEGIAYGTRDKIPVRLFFLLLAPDVHQHLLLLAGLTRLLRDPGMRALLLAAEDPAEVLAIFRKAEERL